MKRWRRASGMVDDVLRVSQAVGMGLAEIRLPVQVRYRTQDVLVPAPHGAWLAAHIPGATVLVGEIPSHATALDERLERIRAFVGD